MIAVILTRPRLSRQIWLEPLVPFDCKLVEFNNISYCFQYDNDNQHLTNLRQTVRQYHPCLECVFEMPTYSCRI